MTSLPQTNAYVTTKLPLARQQRGRLIPRIVSEFNKNDVFMGFYSLPFEYEGNARFRQLLLDRRKDYLRATSRRAKHRITKEIIKAIHDRGGRFLELIEPNKKKAAAAAAAAAAVTGGQEAPAWKIVDTVTILNQKVRQFMRDVGPETRKKRIMQRMELRRCLVDKADELDTPHNKEDLPVEPDMHKTTAPLIMNVSEAAPPPPPLPPKNVLDIEQISFDQTPRSTSSDTQSTTSSVDDLSNVAEFVHGLVAAEQEEQRNRQLLTLLLGSLQGQTNPQPQAISTSPSFVPPATNGPQQLLGQLASLFGQPVPQTQTNWNSTTTTGTPQQQQQHQQDGNAATLAALSLLVGTLNGR